MTAGDFEYFAVQYVAPDGEEAREWFPHEQQQAAETLFQWALDTGTAAAELSKIITIKSYTKES